MSSCSSPPLDFGSSLQMEPLKGSGSLPSFNLPKIEPLKTSGTIPSWQDTLNKLDDIKLPNLFDDDYKIFKASASPKNFGLENNFPILNFGFKKKSLEGSVTTLSFLDIPKIMGPLYGTPKYYVKNPFIYHETLNPSGIIGKPLERIKPIKMLKIDFDFSSIGKVKHDSYDKDSLFKKDNLLYETNKLMKDFGIKDGFLKGINLVDGEIEDHGIGASYSWRENKLNISPIQIDEVKSYGNYENLIKNNFLPHEFGHIKAVQEFGTPAEQRKSKLKIPDINNWAMNEFIADSLADKNSSNFSNTQSHLLGINLWENDSLTNPILKIDNKIENDFYSRKNSHELFKDVLYNKASAKKFGIPELDSAIDYDLHQGLYEKTNNFAKTENWMEKIDKISDKIYNLGEIAMTEDKNKYLKEFKKTQDEIGDLDNDYKEFSLFGKMMKNFRSNFFK